MKKLLLFIALLISGLGLNAQDATFGDLVFTITSETPAECEVSRYSGELVNATIPSTVTISGKEYTVTSIENGTFEGCSSLTSIEIPSGVTSIGAGAFWSCSSLTSIDFGENSQLTSIGGAAFSGCSSLTSIEIPSGVTSIGDSAFEGCSSLTSIEIPSSVTFIGDGAFSWCESLTSIVVESGNTVYDSRNNCNAIIETATNTLIAGCKNTVIPNSVTSIGSSAFAGCSSLTSIEIPSGVTSIGVAAFSNCSSLTSIDFGENSQLTSIGGSAFYGCSSLTSIEIPSGVTSIGNYAFWYCSSLTSIDFGENSQLTSIGKQAFSDCSGLTSIEIPSGVTSIGNQAFYGCSSLTSIEIPSGVTSLGSWVFSGCSSLTSIYCYAETVPVTWSDTFNGCPSDMVIYVPAISVNAYKVTFPWNNYTIMPLACVVTASSNPEEAGVITGTGEYESSDTVTLTATANEGYRFVSWTENNNLVSIDKEYSFVVTTNRNLVANFEKTYEITAIVNPEKVGVVMGKGVYSHGDNVTLVAIPVKTGYEFVNWTEDGEVVSEDVEYSFVATSDRELIANFVLLDYYVSAVANAAEAGEILGSGNYNHGEDVTLTAVANEGYKFVNWTEDGEVISSVEEYSFVIIKDRDLVANFEKLEDPENPEEPGEGVEELTSSFNIYPNPVSDMLFIETEVEIEEVYIFDIYGRRQELSVISCQPSAIDVSGLNSGVYFVKVVTSEGEVVKRFIKK